MYVSTDRSDRQDTNIFNKKKSLKKEIIITRPDDESAYESIRSFEFKGTVSKAEKRFMNKRYRETTRFIVVRRKIMMLKNEK